MTIQINKATLTVQPQVTADFTMLSYVTTDDTDARKLTVMFRPITGGRVPQPITIQGDEYDTLGQWTDTTLKAAICSKLGVTIAGSTP